MKTSKKKQTKKNKHGNLMQQFNASSLNKELSRINSTDKACQSHENRKGKLPQRTLNDKLITSQQPLHIHSALTYTGAHSSAAA